MQVPLMRLQCGCNSYEWGKPGHTSAAAKLASATGFQVQNDKPYAELWMGTHPSLPSKDLETQRSLLELVQDNQALMTPAVSKRYGNKLPFLFKILSISKALSIQAHPNKKLAEQLHARDPQNYPDDNHKPEMTMALTPFTGLCGFRPLAEIAHFLTHVPSLRSLVGEPATANFLTTTKNQEDSADPAQIAKNREALRAAFTALTTTATTSPETLRSASEALVSSAKSSLSSPSPNAPAFAADAGPAPTTGADLARTILTLHSQFPHDAGLFVLFFLNHVRLAEGEAMFLCADDIHAYLSGDIVECMASSDNVVRAGFTPKFKDVGTLSSMLTYSYAPIEAQKMIPTDYTFVKFNADAFRGGSECRLYDPPIEEFAVARTVVKGRGGKATFEALDGPSIVICTGGEGRIAVGKKVEEVREGYVFFVGATAECVLESMGEVPFVTFKAFCELNDEGPASNGTM